MHLGGILYRGGEKKVGDSEISKGGMRECECECICEEIENVTCVREFREPSDPSRPETLLEVASGIARDGVEVEIRVDGRNFGVVELLVLEESEAGVIVDRELGTVAEGTGVGVDVEV